MYVHIIYSLITDCVWFILKYFVEVQLEMPSLANRVLFRPMVSVSNVTKGLRKEKRSAILFHLQY